MILPLFRKEWRATWRGSLLLLLVTTLALSAILGVSWAFESFAAPVIVERGGPENLVILVNGMLSSLALLSLMPLLLVPPFHLASERFAGERSAGTLLFLDALPVSRLRIFGAKFTAGLLQYQLLCLYFTLLLIPMSLRFGGSAVRASDFLGFHWITILSNATLLFAAFCAASILFETTAKAALGGLALLVALILTRDLFPVDQDQGTFALFFAPLLPAVLLIATSAWLWAQDHLLRFRWRAAAILLFLVPAGLSAHSWFSVLTSERPILLDPMGHRAAASRFDDMIVASGGNVWIGGVDRAVQHCRMENGLPRELGKIRFDGRPKLLAARDQLLAVLSDSPPHGVSNPEVMMTLYDARCGESLVWNLGKKPEMTSSLRGSSLMTLWDSGGAVLIHQKLYLCTLDPSGRPVVEMRDETGVDLGSSASGRLFVLRGEPLNISNQAPSLARSNPLHTIRDPVIMVHESGSAAPRPASENERRRIEMTSNLIIDGRVHTVWMNSGGGSRLPFSRPSLLLPESDSSAGFGVFASTDRDAPYVMELAPLANCVWDDESATSMRTLFSGRNDVLYRVLWPRMPRGYLDRDLPSVSAMATDGRYVYALSDAGLIWIDVTSLPP